MENGRHASGPRGGADEDRGPADARLLSHAHRRRLDRGHVRGPMKRRPHPARPRARVLLGSIGLLVLAAGLVTPSHNSGGTFASSASSAQVAGTSHLCPWVTASLRHQGSPATLASEVVARMTLPQKAGFVVLRSRGGTENINDGVPSLCIPPLRLSDGPNGVAYHVSGVTQLPAAIGDAASFNPTDRARQPDRFWAPKPVTRGSVSPRVPNSTWPVYPRVAGFLKRSGRTPT